MARQTKLFYSDDEHRLRTVKEQVYNLYERFPESIHSDTILFMIYLKEYHNINSEMSLKYLIGYFKSIGKDSSGVEASVRRSGRYWRMKLPGKYERDKERGLELERAFRETFRRGE